MPIILKRKYDFDSTEFTKTELPVVVKLIESFRTGFFDDIPEKNILDKFQYHYTDKKIIALLKKALNDINAAVPNNFTFLTMYQSYGTEILIKGAIVFALMGEGLLQLRNQVDYSDNGLSIGMFNKTGQYQSWVNFLLQEYMQEKKNLKADSRANEINAGFVGISSEFGYYGWWLNGYSN